MDKKCLALFQILLIVLNAISGVYYSPIYIGQWKVRVAFFGMFTILFVLVTAVAFIVSIVKRRNIVLLPIMNGVFCIMQLFPMIEAFMLSGFYLRNAIFHIIVLIIGVISFTYQSKYKRKIPQLLQSKHNLIFAPLIPSTQKNREHDTNIGCHAPVCY